MQRLIARAGLRHLAVPLAAAGLLVACAGLPGRADAPGREADGAVAPTTAWPLSPRDLPAPLALQQQLVIERDGQSRTFDAMLEADADGLRLAVLAAGQVALSLQWKDGALDQQRADWLPPQLDGALVLQDLQFALWPLAALQRVAPPGWTVVEDGVVRTIAASGRVVVAVRRTGPGQFTLERPDAGYRLTVRSVAVEERRP